MKTIIASLSAKNIHKTLAPWCLKAFCDKSGVEGVIVLEASVNESAQDILARIFKEEPQVVAFSCYIWNIEMISKIGVLLNKLLPEVIIILGGPEVSFEKDLSGYPYADYIIRGAGEKAFCALLSGLKCKKTYDLRVLGCGEKVHNCERFENYPSPFSCDYFESFKKNPIPLAKQLIYYESARGCPFSCAYCLSSATEGVHYLPLKRVKKEISLLVENGAKCIKFVDRTFNADNERACEILKFVSGLSTDCVFHFECAPELFNEELFKIIENLPLGRVQFELGVQSVNPESLKAVNRFCKTETALENIKRLTSFGNCHVHLGLIAGLPHESLASLSRAVDECVKAKPHALQLGFLKMLKGAKITNSDFGAVFTDFPPYEVISTDSLPFADMITLKKCEAIIDKYYNSGAFTETLEYAFEIFKTPYSFFESFADFCEESGLNAKISLKNAYTALQKFLCLHGDSKEIAHRIKTDCLCYEISASLPDGIKPIRNSEAEVKYRPNLKKFANFRIEFFEKDNCHKLIIYESKNPVTNRYPIKDIIL
ncbi:MAG: DUF4080 domain-containing protein [Firmicutes bacterium]|nr:DUF4080 domain-containing protein [Bacillota bacterium]